MPALVPVIARAQERAATGAEAARTIARLLRVARDTPPDLERDLTELAAIARELTDAVAASVTIVADDGAVELVVTRGQPTDAAALVAVAVPGELGTFEVWGALDADDEGVVAGLAELAATAVAHERVGQEARLALRWIAAAEEVDARLASGDVSDADLTAVVAQVVQLADAAFVGLVRAGATRFAAQAGPLSYNSTLERSPAFHALARDISENLAEHATGVSAPAIEERAGESIGGFGPTMVVPWGDADRAPDGAFLVARGTGAPDFSRAERELAERFVRSASTSWALLRARTDRERLALSDERDRIARDLHDHVIQSLFGVGLGLQSVLGATTGQTQARVSAQIDAIDAIIRQVRTTIFQLGEEPSRLAYSQKQRLNQLVRTALEGEAIDSSLEFAGPVDTLVDSELGDDVEAVLREALSNIVRHAHASRVDIAVVVADDEVRVLVTDNGRGVGRPTRRSGLDNLAARAASRGGRFAIAAKAPTGTTLDWSVPLTGGAA
ncbi:histidine kinase [Galbitalea sp. SE-J8]|uniref:sensor histidine kinase n=1 Tax=Galbitalea sp. SE-J8 TaxID=3054952 RepID=UPI00259D1B1A|nr:histidine kinase [Galbitalea sp. SE-J8]MDM4764183.1 histidine kinase [Galbitalea sp. SE-J8]